MKTIRLALLVVGMLVLGTSTVVADPPDKDAREAQKKQMEWEREEQKNWQEQERESRKLEAEIEREEQKHYEEMARERQKHYEEVLREEQRIPDTEPETRKYSSQE